ncbi:MAG: glycosyltransferase family 9 protein [Anaerolineae bacterium]|nr:glycosyltransferase family 9 protein [Anaerolineae bacterium]
MRIVLILPCCIGDVVMATPTLTALRNAYPDAHITWAVGGWSRRAVEYHPSVDAILDTGHAALPIKSLSGFLSFVQKLRSGKFDLAVSLVRSPLMSLAVWLSGIPQRAGLDSKRRGFGYTIRAPIDPSEARHEVEIYLDVARAMGIDTTDMTINLPVLAETRQRVALLLTERGINKPYFVVNPTGGGNPGMMMDSKRYPPAYLATVSDALAAELEITPILIGGAADGQVVENLRHQVKTAAQTFIGNLTFPEMGALAAAAQFYIGNDTGITHLVAASGAKTIMILGPSDPKRYAPYTKNSLALWKPVALKDGGVANSENSKWDWARDGIQPNEALKQIRRFLTLENDSAKS